MEITGNGQPMAALHALRGASHHLGRKRFMCRAFILLCLSLVLLTGCQENVKKEVNIMSSNATVRLGEQGEALARRYPNQAHIDRQHGASFYSIDWKPSAPGTVTFEHGKHTFTIENVLGLMGYQSADFSEEGVLQFDINAGITTPEFIAHDEARHQMFAVLQKILQAGWTITIPSSRPRLRGRDMVNYLFTEKTTTLDATYMPTFEEWMQMESLTTWSFYADHVYLEVSFTREHTLTDPTKPGAYLIGFNLKNEAEYFRGYVDPHERKRWKELLSAELAMAAQMRIEAEAKMRAKGVQIDETYQDPPVPAF